MEMRTQQPIRLALDELLKRREMTQTELAAFSGVSPAAISMYLSGKRGVEIDRKAALTIKRLAEALGVQFDYFVEARAWRLSQISIWNPGMMEEFYNLILQVATSLGYEDSLENGYESTTDEE